MLELIISGAIAGVCGFIGTYLYTKILWKKAKTFLQSEQFYQNVGEIGDMFGQGLLMNLKGAEEKGQQIPTTSIMGFEIPTPILTAIMQKFMGVEGTKRGPEESQKFKY